MVQTSIAGMGSLSIGIGISPCGWLLCLRVQTVLVSGPFPGCCCFRKASPTSPPANDFPVVVVDRPSRIRRRGRGKSDRTGAENPARAVLAEALRMLNGARRTAVNAKTQAVNQFRVLLVSAPQSIRGMAPKANLAQCIVACAGLDCGDERNPVIASVTTTLRLLAKRWNALHEELKELDQQLSRMTKIAAHRLLGRFGVEPKTAATLLITGHGGR